MTTEPIQTAFLSMTGTGTGTPITRTASWWADLLAGYDDASDVDDFGLALFDAETVGAVMERVGRAVEAAPHLSSAVTIVLSDDELFDVFPVGVPGGDRGEGEGACSSSK